MEHVFTTFNSTEIAEAYKLGFEKIFVSKYNAKGLDTNQFKIQVVSVASVYELGAELFGKGK